MKTLPCRALGALTAVTLFWAAAGAHASEPVRKTLPNGSQVQFDGRYYDYRADDGRKMIKMWVPPGVSPVRGMFITGHGGGSGDSRSFPRDPNFQAYAARHRFAVVGLHYFPGRQVFDDGARVFARALDAFAALGTHPEIAHLPFVVFGGSNGGATAYGLACALPTRAIAFTPNAAAWWNPTTPPEAALEVPGLFVVGIFDPFMRGTGVETTRQLVADARRRGARWSFIAEEKGHEDGATWQIFTRFWDRAIDLRLPSGADPSKGPVALREIPEADGWLVDMTSWSSGLTRIAPFAEYARDRAAAGWVPDADTAFLYRSVATYDNPLVLSSRDVSQAFNPDTDYRSRLVGVADPPVAPGTAVRLECDTTAFPDYERLEFYDGAELLGAVPAGREPALAITVDGAKRVYNVSVLGHGKDGTTRASTPLYFYVEDPEVEVEGASLEPAFDGGALTLDGSRTATNDSAAVDPKDQVLVAYGLTAAQERQFDPADGALSPFWGLIDDRHDHIFMTQKDNAPKGNGFAGVIDHDARLLVKAAHTASGLYLFFETTDNRFVDVEDPDLYEHHDAVDVLLDSRSSAQICAGDPEKTFVNVHWGISLTSSQYQSACGDTSRPTRIKRNVADPWDMKYELIERTDLATRYGMQIDCAIVDKYRTAQEWFVPWSEVGGGRDGEPAMGTRLGFAPGYNDRDPGEYLDSGGHDQLRWVERSSPWGHEAIKGEPPLGWGDLEIGPFLGE